MMMTDARHTADLNTPTATAAGDRGNPQQQLSHSK
jgi:hypothetical protein